MSQIYFPETTGLCNVLYHDKLHKLPFFEIDTENKDEIDLILRTYHLMHLDVLYHRTKNGYHFLSPTLLTVENWKIFHNYLLHLNKKCPMICLRVQANKYPGEDNYFYTYKTEINTIPYYNVKSVCLYLNKIFGSNLQGSMDGDIKIVKYKPHLRNHPWYQ